MEYRQLGCSGLRISAMTLGTMGFGGGGMFAKSVPATCRTPGVRSTWPYRRTPASTVIDTADIYSMGRAEEIVGEAPGTRRDNVILATKAGFPMGEGRTTRAFPAIISSGPVRPACGGSGLTTSTSTSSTSGTGRRRSRRRSAPSSTSSRAARCATSGVRTSPAGRS